jgi:hypothetical protein
MLRICLRNKKLKLIDVCEENTRFVGDTMAYFDANFKKKRGVLRLVKPTDIDTSSTI